MKRILSLFLLIFIICGCNGSNDSQSNEKFEDLELQIEVKANLISNEYLLEGDTISFIFTANKLIESVMINGKYYILVDDKVDYRVPNIDELKIDITKIRIAGVIYDLYKTYDYKIISKAELTEISINTDIKPNGIGIKLENYNHNFPIYVRIVSSVDNFISDVLYEDNLYFDDLKINSFYAVKLYLLKENEEHFVFREIDVVTSDILTISETKVDPYGYLLKVEPINGFSIDYYTFGDNKYEYESNLINVTKPKGKDEYYDLVFYGTCNGKSASYHTSLYFDYVSSEGDFEIEISEYSTEYVINVISNYDYRLYQTYELNIYLGDALLDSINSNYYSLKDFYFDREYVISATISFIDFETLETKTKTKNITFKTKSYYEGNNEFISISEDQGVFIVKNLAPHDLEIYYIEVFFGTELVKTTTSLVISSLDAGKEYIIKVHYLLNLHNGLDWQENSEVFVMRTSYIEPNYEIKYDATYGMVNYEIVGDDINSLIIEKEVRLYEDSVLLDKNANFIGTFSNLDYQKDYYIYFYYKFYSLGVQENIIRTFPINVTKPLDEPDFNVNFDSEKSVLEVISSVEYDYNVVINKIEELLFNFPVDVKQENNKIYLSNWPLEELSKFTYEFDLDVEYQYKGKDKKYNLTFYLMYEGGVWDLLC